jgi:hypothetical protein
MKLKRNLIVAVLILIVCSSNAIRAQSEGVGISNIAITPHASAILEMRTTDKGLLIPRMTTAERNSITSPATGLMLYNTETNQYDFYNGSAWVYWESPVHLSATAAQEFTTSATTDVVITGMEKTVEVAGTYAVYYNGQVKIPAVNYTTVFDTEDAAVDMISIFDTITQIEATNTIHANTFGSGETLTPGVYDITGAASIALALTLDGEIDPADIDTTDSPVFIIRATAAFSTGAATKVKLINGAVAANVFWVATSASTGANTLLKGTVLATTGAITTGADTVITGRLLKKAAGAITFGANSLVSVPEGESIINFKSLADFAVFADVGGIALEASSIYNGNIGANATTITDPGATVNGEIFQPGETEVLTPISHMATFSLYKDDELIPYSSRTRTHLNNPSDIALLGLSSIEENEKISVRSKVDSQNSDGIEIAVSNGIFTLIKVGN